MLQVWSREIILDLDATDDPLHGNQQGAFFHGYYRHYCYLPLYCFCGNVPLLAQLRDAKRDASSGTVEALKKISFAIRKRFGRKVRIIVRADSGFAREETMAWCEQNGVYYCLGLARNKRLSARLGKCFGELYRGINTGEIPVPCRRFEDFEYRTRKSWSRARRVVGKAEILDKKQNPRFVVTNLLLKASPTSLKSALQLPLSTKSFTARAEKWKTASRRRSRISLPIAAARTGWPPTNSGSGSRLSLISCSRCCGPRCARHRSGRGHPRPDPAQTLQDWCPHQDQLSAHSSGVSQRLSLPGNSPARLCQPLRNAGGLNFKEALVATRKRAGFSQRRTLLPSSHRQRKKTTAAYSATLTRPDKPEWAQKSAP